MLLPRCARASTAALACALVLAAPAAARPKRPVSLTTGDVVALPGAPVDLRIKLERKGFGLASKNLVKAGISGIWNADLEGRTVSFHAGNQVLGTRVTDDEGEASVTWTPPGPGDHPVTVRFAGDYKYAPGEDTLVCMVRPASTRFAVLDIDHTLSHTSTKNVVKGKVDDPPFEHSLAVVERLLEEYEVLYVSARVRKFQDVTKRWLAHHGYPRKPVFLMRYKDYPSYNEAAYKTDTLSRLKADFPELVVGVGDKDSDAEAYAAVHIPRAFILGDAGGVDGAVEVADWFEVEQQLFDPRGRSFRSLHGED